MNRIIKKIKSYKFSKIKRSYKPADITTHHNKYGSLYIFPNSSIGSQLIVNNSFEQEDTEYLATIIKKDWNIIDIGANIGYYTLIFSVKANQGYVYAFDPIKSHCSILQLMCWSNKLKNVSILESAVSDKVGEVEFSHAVDGAFSSILDTKRIETQEKIIVPTNTLDNFCQEENIKKIDLLKIDAEGAESLILNGSQNLLSSQKIKLIMMEHCPENFIHYETSKEEIHNFILKFGYTAYYVRDCKKVPFKPNENTSRSINVFYELI